MKSRNKGRYTLHQEQMIDEQKPSHRTNINIRGMKAMHSTRKSMAVALLAALVLAIFGAIQPAMAVAGNPGAPSGDGVNPIWVDGNPSCATLNADNTNFPTITSDFGFKLDGVPVGTFQLTNGTGTLTGGAPSDSSNSVTISNKGSDNTFDWSATFVVDAVIVKGGDNASAFVYSPANSADTELHAPVNPNNNKYYGLSHVEFCYKIVPKVPLTASKTAVGSYDRTITWQLEKSVSPASHSGNAGEDAGSSTWTVEATKNESKGNYQVIGTITITNSNGFPVNFTVSDKLSDNTVATVTCPVTNNNTGTVAANGQIVCNYTASPTDKTATKNTATITSNTAGVGGATAEAPLSFTENVIGDETVTIGDSRKPAGFPQSISETKTFTYDETFSCSSHPNDYTAGMDIDQYPNTATLTGDNTDLSDDATVTVNCYAPVVSKDAEGTHEKEYTWTITKDADGNYVKFIGDSATTHDYTVTVDQTLDETFTVSGTITVHNPNPDEPMSVSLFDEVGGVEATLACADPLVVAAGATETCDYSVAVNSNAGGTNTVTATFNNIDFEASANYAFGTPVIQGYPTIDVVDSNGEEWNDISADSEFKYTEDFTCPANLNQYVNGVYTAADYVNTATIDQTGQNDKATVKLTCYAPVVSKDAQASREVTYTWSIDKEADATYVKFIGDPDTTHDYTVTVDRKEEQRSVVSGEITVHNPHPSQPLSVSLEDTVAGVPVTLACSNPLNVAAGATETCAYTVELPNAIDGTNTVTATFNGIDFEASALYAFGAPVIHGYPTIDVTDSNGEEWNNVTADSEFKYTEDFTCPADLAKYDDGVYELNHVNTATIDQTGQNDTATVDLTCYAPVVSKDADALHEQEYTWTINKDADGNYVKFIGDPATTHNYTVTVDQTLDETFTVSGTITVKNPRPDAAMNVTLEDTVAGVPVTLACSNPLNVAAGATETCDYTVELPGAIDGTNVVTATFNNIGFEASALYAFGNPVVYGYQTIDVVDSNGEEWNDVTADSEFKYTEDFSCPTDLNAYNNGMYVLNHVNTATIDQTGQNDTATVGLTCYAPVVSKDAEATHGTFYTWGITKDADAAYSKFIGDPATSHKYTVTVDQTAQHSYLVNGTITVQNPRPDAAMSVSLEDVVDGVPATLNCSNPLVVAASGTATCDYSVELASDIDGTNTVTATFNQVKITATAVYEFGDPEVTGSSAVTVTDTNGEVWQNITGDSTFTYDEQFSCPANLDAYQNGIFVAADHVNTATINETGQSDTATVKLTCYAPVVSKNAQTEWQREYTWEITKTVEPSSHSGFAGDEFASTYSVTVDQTVIEGGYRAFGLISVTNPAGSPGPMTIDVSDSVDGSVAVVDCDAQSDGNQGMLTVQPGETRSCAYSVNLPDATDRTNTATATFQQIAFPATAAVNFGEPTIVGEPTINVVDFFDGALDGEPLGEASEDTTFTYTRPFVCPVGEESYTDGFLVRLIPNIARIVETGQEDNASVEVVCELRAGLGDFVWFDQNQNGQQDAGEPGILGVTVELLQNGNVISTTVTDANGGYSFTGLLAGTYSVRFPTTGLTALDQGDDASDSDADLATGLVTTTLDAGEFDPTLDAGYLPAALGDLVWLDTNRNGQQDAGEPGIAGVTVELLQNGSVIGTTTTDANGFYSFTGLQAGTYTVRFPTLNLTNVNVGDASTDSDADLNEGTTTVELAWGEVNNTLDAGYVPVASPLASLGDLVWLDTLEDGIQGADELGVQGVTVRLLQGGNVISTTVTDENGFYLFDKLQPGDYVVCFGLPEDYDFINANVGGDDEKDSDASQTDGCTEVITLEIGENDRSWDAGLVQIEPTAEEEVDQPGSPQQLFLPSLRNNE